MLLGIDFDNTIVCYDQIFQQVALEKQLIPEAIPASKERIRAYLREQGQEQTWTELQGIVYGPRIKDAIPFSGVLDFLRRCRQEGIGLRIISHKTEFAPYDVARSTNLRTAALKWMALRNFFTQTGLGFTEEDVLFGATRQEKIDHIRRSGCTHFIDDLEEVFLEKHFPASVQKILFAPNYQPLTLQGVVTPASWQEISECFFGKPS